jgi:hypothetical protein
MNLDKLGEYAPFILMVLMFFWQNNVFVRPDQLEKKHREILDDLDEKLDKKVTNKYVEINAYKEFQNHIYSELGKMSKGIEDLKEFLIK